MTTTTLEAAAVGADIAECDREPIQFSGAIQPHGLLALVDARLSLAGGAGVGAEELFSLGASAVSVVGVEFAKRMAAAAPETTTLIGRTRLRGSEWDVVAHREGSGWLVEFEPAPHGPRLSAEDVLDELDVAGCVFERAGDLRALCGVGASLFQKITGFDHVMIYRFLDDGSGVVLAEERAADTHAFLNHHFPASDIPKQARALYVRNRVRVIADVNYRPAPIFPADRRDVDLSDVGLRSVSPTHLEYLRNMGIAASASVSIVKDNLLWGLVACHHGAPRGLSLIDRMTCQALAGGFARQVRAKEEAEGYRERLRIRAAEDAVAARIATSPPHELSIDAADDLLRMLDADGFATLSDGQLSLSGRCPDRDDVRLLAEWVLATAGARTFHTDRLAQHFAPAADFADLASGLLAFVVPTEPPTAYLWLRAEALQVVKWAGDPHKAAKLAPGERLSPRKSFDAWSQEVCGRSRPWSPVEVEGAHRFRTTIYESRQTRRIHELNRELTAAVAEKDGLLAQKDFLLKEVNHRVQNSLQLVSAFLSLQARQENDPTLTRALGEAQRRLSAVALVHRRLYTGATVESVDLARYLEDLVADMGVSMGPEWAEQLTLDLAPVLVPADAAVNVGLILTELLINAQKYAYGGRAGPIDVALEQHRNRFRLIVADKGAGRQGARTGFGSRMLRAVVEGLNGVLEETDNRPGLRVFVSAPIRAA